ncbi:HTH-type transcriptional regulator BetI [Mycobacterium marinum]|uniref:HTH-type transcriptional regulator BetI n=2 Tax=Mycobacterium marinum TaxID=1781 RepID=A0A3E2MYM1_MYCMR|nr:HTH-type transcriptional regulator BetI [Mycobacterium marinum]EPQ70234.1 transcriptional regulator, TetR family [Mycobacterium marinum str. Europe]CDM75144.1 transcriptional regulator BetI [Mycobacterium marinum E11]AXN48413.1 HTH-type transcriptional regulator BetI [Mycobacterium marinum]RFZ07412.1 HTH-type transcriptional regulator BetI [Mycobacterium marinum]
MTEADSSTAKRRMTAQGRREQILDVTHAIIDADGFHAATPIRIAREAGINRSLIYQQFGGPAGLFVALIDREAGRAGEQFAEAISDLGEPSEENQTLVRAFDGVLAAVDAHTATWRLFLFPPQGAPPQLHTRLAQSQTIVREFLQGELQRLNPQLDDPEYTARVLYATGRELLQLRLSEPQTATPERLRAFVHGLRANLIGPSR